MQGNTPAILSAGGLKKCLSHTDRVGQTEGAKGVDKGEAKGAKALQNCLQVKQGIQLLCLYNAQSNVVQQEYY